jgi:hypothetical protein
MRLNPTLIFFSLDYKDIAIVSERTLIHTHTHPRAHTRPTNYTHCTRPSGYRRSPTDSTSDGHVALLHAYIQGPGNIYLGKKTPIPHPADPHLGFERGGWPPRRERSTSALANLTLIRYEDLHILMDRHKITELHI